MGRTLVFVAAVCFTVASSMDILAFQPSDELLKSLFPELNISEPLRAKRDTNAEDGLKECLLKNFPSGFVAKDCDDAMYHYTGRRLAIFACAAEYNNTLVTNTLLPVLETSLELQMDILCNDQKFHDEVKCVLSGAAPHVFDSSSDDSSDSSSDNSSSIKDTLKSSTDNDTVLPRELRYDDNNTASLEVRMVPEEEESVGGPDDIVCRMTVRVEQAVRQRAMACNLQSIAAERLIVLTNHLVLAALFKSEDQVSANDCNGIKYIKKVSA